MLYLYKQSASASALLGIYLLANVIKARMTFWPLKGSIACMRACVRGEIGQRRQLSGRHADDTRHTQWWPRHTALLATTGRQSFLWRAHAHTSLFIKGERACSQLSPVAPACNLSIAVESGPTFMSRLPRADCVVGRQQSFVPIGTFPCIKHKMHRKIIRDFEKPVFNIVLPHACTNIPLQQETVKKE